jgi:hypothetical protein
MRVKNAMIIQKKKIKTKNLLYVYFEKAKKIKKNKKLKKLNFEKTIIAGGYMFY